MNIEITQEEAKNVQMCLVRVAKLPDITATEMAYLLNLTGKFNEQPKEPEIVEEVKES